MSDDKEVEVEQEPLAIRQAAITVGISAETFDSAARTWIDGHVRNSPVSGATEAWNHLLGVLPRLRDYLNDELKK